MVILKVINILLFKSATSKTITKMFEIQKFNKLNAKSRLAGTKKIYFQLILKNVY